MSTPDPTSTLPDVQDSSQPSSPQHKHTPEPQLNETQSKEPAPSYVKLAMRNMVRKGRKSLFHFTLTVTALMALLVGLAYLTR